MGLKEIIQLYRTLIPKKEKPLFLLILLFMLLSAGLETFSIGAIFPFVTLVINPLETLNERQFLAQFFRTGQSFFGHHFILVLAGGLFLTFVAKNLILYLLVVFGNKVIFRNMTHSESRLFSWYLKAPYLFHTTTNTANLIRNVTLEVGNLFNSVLRSVLSITVDLLTIAAILALLVLVSPTITLGTFISLGLISFFFNRAVGNWLTKYGRVRQEAAAKLIQWINQGLGAIREIKVLGCEDYFVGHYKEAAVRHRNAEASFNSFGQIPRFFFETLAVTAMLVLIVISAGSQASHENVIPLIAMFSLAGMRLAPAFNRISGQVGILKYYQPTLELIHHELHQLNVLEKECIPLTSTSTPSLQGLFLDHVSFRYPNQTKDALSNVTLHITTNESVGIMGESGAGKTTLVSIILGLMRPIQGATLIDGYPLDEVIRKRRRFIGYVPQEVYLSDDTIRNNIAYGLTSNEIDEGRVWKVLRQSHLDDFIASLPDGIHTVVGERGARISGGQKQRIGIARALYSDPKLLVLDEPTSALDHSTEKEIAATLNEISVDKMVIIVTHRPGLLKHCHRVFQMVDGRLEEEALHDSRAAVS